MKSVQASAKVSPKNSELWVDKFARKLVLNILNRSNLGKLTIHEADQVHVFGESTEACAVDAHIYVNHLSAYRAVLLRGTVGSGEAYMSNAWWSPDLVQVIRFFVVNMAVIEALDSRFSHFGQWLFRWQHARRKNTQENARLNIAAHYDLGNEFYKQFLDPTMMYSSAVFDEQAQTLEQASRNKLEAICRKLELSEADHLLEIGSGWGGMAVYAAKQYGCKVTTVTLSRQQYDYASAWVAREGLSDLVEVKVQDYRDITGQFDKLVSIEMIEAVGYRYFDTFFNKCASLLKPEGLMLIQAITISDQRYEREKDNADFIQTYIFPGGCLPSITALCQSMTRASDFCLVDQCEIAHHYAQTLAHWRTRFEGALDQIKNMGFDDVFIRMWRFYLCYCEGGFRERVIGTSQLLFAKPRWQPV